MKEKRILNPYRVFAIGLLSLFFIACSKEETPIPAPVAGFDHVINGKTVTLTNTSTDAVSYAWDFGDGSTSTEESPSHTYEANGGYIIKLTATNESGSDDSEEVVEIINITIDGDFSDWDDVEAVAYTGEGAIKEVKVENLANRKLYFYVRGTSETTSFLDLYLNLDYAKLADGDTTGLNTNVYPMSNLGWDILFEGFFGNQQARENYSGMFYGIFYYPTDADGIFSNNTDFGTRDEPVLQSDHINFTDFKSVGTDGDVAYEFSIDLTFFPTSLQPDEGAEIQFFIDEWDNALDGTGWWGGFLSHFPNGQTTDEGEAVTYKLK